MQFINVKFIEADIRAGTSVKNTRAFSRVDPNRDADKPSSYAAPRTVRYVPSLRARRFMRIGE